MLRVWSRQGENTTEYQHCIQWTLKAVKDREQRVKEAGVDGEAEFEGKSKKEREDERNRSRGGREGLNFNPRVTEFTDICTRIRLAVPHSFSETTLSLLSIPKTYSSSYILSRMRPFTVLRAEKEKKKNTEKQTELNVLNSSNVCVTICNPVCPQDSSCILYAFLWKN